MHLKPITWPRDTIEEAPSRTVFDDCIVYGIIGDTVEYERFNGVGDYFAGTCEKPYILKVNEPLWELSARYQMYGLIGTRKDFGGVELAQVVFMFSRSKFPKSRWFEDMQVYMYLSHDASSEVLSRNLLSAFNVTWKFDTIKT